MTQSAAHAAVFFDEVAAGARLWSIKDEGGFPAPVGLDGQRAMPFWSKLSRAERVIERVPTYSGFEAVEIPLRDFVDRWLPGLTRDRTLVGLNWSGPSATGYDLDPETVRGRLEAMGI